MHTVIVLIDNADHAVQLLATTLLEQQQPTRWVLVGCSPRVTRHLSRFVTHSARSAWRNSWGDKVFAQVIAKLRSHNRPLDVVLTQIAPAKQAIGELAIALTSQYSAHQVLDARRPKLEQDLSPITQTPKPDAKVLTRYVAAFTGASLLAGFEWA